jgi:hypothetical protein
MRSKTGETDLGNILPGMRDVSALSDKPGNYWLMSPFVEAEAPEHQLKWMLKRKNKDGERVIWFNKQKVVTNLGK